MGQVHLKVAISLGWECVAVVEPNLKEQGINLIPATALVLPHWDDSIRGLDPEAVILSSTTDVRTSLFEQVLELESLGTLITEKPLSNSLEASNLLVERAREKDVSVAVNHQMRFTELYEFLGRVVSSRKYGDLLGIHVAGANFGLGNNAVHFVEIASFLMGEVPLSFTSALEAEPISSPRGENFEDQSGNLELEFSGNRRVSIDFRSGLAHGVYSILSFQFAKIVVNELSGKVEISSRKPEDFQLPSTKYAQEGSEETLEFGSVDLVEGTMALYRSLEKEDHVESLLRAQSANEVVIKALLASKSLHGGLGARNLDTSAFKAPWA